MKMKKMFIAAIASLMLFSCNNPTKEKTSDMEQKMLW